jgi:NADPH2:quinone reductase
LTREEFEWRANEIFDLIAAGKLRVDIGATFALENAAAAHDALEGRTTTGKVLLLP